MWRAEPSIEGEDQRLARTSSQGLRYGVPGRGRNEANKHPQCQWENSYHRYFFAYVHILFRKLQQVLKIFSNYQIHHLNSFYIKTSFQFMYESLWKVCFSFLVTIQCTVFQRFSFWSLKWAYGGSWLPTSGRGLLSCSWSWSLVFGRQEGRTLGELVTDGACGGGVGHPGERGVLSDVCTLWHISDTEDER